MCINPLPITNLLTNVLRAPGSASAMTSMRPSTLKAHEVALRNKKGREVLMMDLKVRRPARIPDRVQRMFFHLHQNWFQRDVQNATCMARRTTTF